MAGLAALAVVAALIVGGILLSTRGNGPQTRDDSHPATATSPAASGASSPTVPPATPPAVSVDASSAPPVGVAASSPPPAASHDSALRAALGHASNERTARQSLTEADSLSRSVTSPEETVFLAMIRAQAYGTLGNEDRSCEIIRKSAPLAAGTRYESKMKEMVALCR